MDAQSYLERIAEGIDRAAAPTAENLRRLHRAHLYAVPFENLDIHLGRPIVLDEQQLYEKIVTRRRGGFCYELNGMFAWLLEQLSYRVRRLSAGVARADGSFGPDFDHLTLWVECPADPKPSVRWLADVGFGAGFLEPLSLDSPAEQADGMSAFRITPCVGLETDASERRVLEQRDSNGAWQPQYRFSLEPRRLDEFAAMCLYHQTSPQSSFTRQRVCTRATPSGRITLDDTRFIVTANGKRTERSVKTPEEYRTLLQREFGISDV